MPPLRERPLVKLLGKFQKYFRCFNTRKRSKSSWKARPITFLNRMELPTDSLINSSNTSAASTRTKGPLRPGKYGQLPEILQHAEGPNHPGKHGPPLLKTALGVALGYVPEVLQMLQHAQGVQSIQESTAHHLFEPHGMAN